MKKIFILLFFLWQEDINAQTPSIKKMRQLTAQAQQGIGIRPEDLAKDVSDDADIKMPVKDVKRIAAIPGRIFSYSELCEYIKQVHAAVEKKLHLENLSDLNNFYNVLRNDSLHKNIADNAASGLMLLGEVNAAIWLMGKASIDNPVNCNILNNYAAFLVMNGGEHLAIPILNRLNYFYPGNVTILNNLGQAWFGLGEFAEANKYLDTAQMIFPAHAQVSNTKSYIEEAKGNKEEAVKQAKESIKEVYSKSKENHIKKMGGKLNDEDITWNQYMPEDAVGFDKLLAQRPAFYTNREEYIALQPEWEAFAEACNTLSEKIKASVEEIDPSNTIKQMPQATNNGRTIINPAFWVRKAQAKLKIEAEDYEQHVLKWLKKKQVINDSIYRVQVDFDNLTTAIEEKYANMPAPNGQEETEKRNQAHKNEICWAEKSYAAKLFSINEQLREFCFDWTSREKRFRKNSIYYNKFILPSEDLLQQETAANELGFVAMIRDLAPIGMHPAMINEGVILSYDFSNCEEPATPPEKPVKVLPDFDIINCKSKSEFAVPRIGKITLECNIMTTEIDDKLPIHGSYTENWVKGEFVKGSVGVGGDLGIVDVGVDINFNDKGFTNGTVKIEKDINVVKTVTGPLQVGVKGTAGVTIGFGSDGIEDVTLTGAVKGNANASGGDKDNTVGKEMNVKTGATGSMVWNAGGFSDGKGKFSGVSIAGFK